MLRSLYSAVTGMQAHQTKLDVIGNNIANVNTYGFKSSKARFQDVFYQTLANSTGGNNLKGGTNASQVGYGTAIAGIDMDMSRSSLQATGNTKDLAIAGEGFFQVKDGDGNIFYTRAGKLQIDPNTGSLVDTNGYTVLGVSGNPLGKAASSDQIRLSVTNKQTAQGQDAKTINGINFTITSQNATTSANVAFTFELDATLPDGADVYVKPSDLTDTTINVRVNPNAVFNNLTELNEKMNTAITRANGGKEHPAGNFTIEAAPIDQIFKQPLTGTQLLDNTFNVEPGVMTFNDPIDQTKGILGGFKPSTTSTEPMFTASGDVDYKIEHVAADAATGKPAYYKITATVHDAAGDRTFSGEVNENSTSANKVWLTEESTPAGEKAGQYIEMSHLGYTAIDSHFNTPGVTHPTTAVDAGTITKAQVSQNLGLSSGFKLNGGSEGGALDLSKLSIAILSNGIIRATHPDEGEIEIGRVDLAMFENPNGLEEVGGGCYFKQGANSGEPNLVRAGEGGSGALQSSALEMSNVDISDEFADMIVTQRGFQANSRIITVSDSILEELVNLKR